MVFFMTSHDVKKLIILFVMIGLEIVLIIKK